MTYPRTKQIMRVVAEASVEGMTERGYALRDAARAAIEQMEDELGSARLVCVQDTSVASPSQVARLSAEDIRPWPRLSNALAIEEAGREGQLPDEYRLTAVERFVHEYEDADEVRAEWFRKRLVEMVNGYLDERTRKSGVPPKMGVPVDGVHLIERERARQIAKEGWHAGHDDDHDNGSLASAAACYADLAAQQAVGDDNPCTDRAPPNAWPWDAEWWKPKDQLRNLVRAGALIAAEIDRVTRAEAVRVATASKGHQHG